MAHGQNAPVIIKRKKVVGGGGHHGGAWKVAYADFVTAMMAFFMLMWLLNATTEKQRKGIADYFNPTIPVNRVSGGGEGAFGGESVFSERVLAQTGTGAAQPSPTPERQARGTIGAQSSSEDRAEARSQAEASVFREIEDMLNGKAGETLLSEQMMRHIVTRLTDEGLIVEIFDLDDAALFETDTTTPMPVLDELVAIIGQAFAIVRNGVSVSGHVSARPVVLAENPVWDLSTARAQTVRRMLQDMGIDPERFQRISGYADRKPAVDAPMAPRNNRLELVLLRSDITN
ncbi:chemotaxis protein MotB [Rhodovulum sp. ES.010]|uniref:OmpA/MotB family protein n=1 Tax=Rhodovulum sp. ES.010 TaxID=1882821 RepID=UPI00092C3A00|nr:flagellar motor protein MotB [Rhodovulum sp. ES.010]SIO49717.1 chemotaxis protein MotB [Rhodovulum sp. ES.010]